MNADAQPLLSVQNLRVEFATRNGTIEVLDGVNFDVSRGTRLGLIGEGGSGKSVLARAILGLTRPPGRISGGKILFRGQDLLSMRSRAWDGIRGRNIALIPQDASLALNPVYKVGAQMTEALTQHISMSKHDARRRVLTTLERAGLGDSGRVFEAYPHELSGGMKQRVAIALALLCDPAVIIADDPTSAVDVTIQAQILKEFGDLVSRTNVSLIFISHDLRVVTSVCDVVAVLYAGQLNELGPAEQIRDSVHPYTRALVRCAPTVERRVEPLPTIPGGGGANPCTLSGCRFNARCSRAEARCKETMPGLTAAGEGHLRACWNPFD